MSCSKRPCSRPADRPLMMPGATGCIPSRGASSTPNYPWPLGRSAGDLRGRAHALRLLGRATRSRGNLADAQRLLMEAEALLAQYGHGDDVAIVRASRADLLRLSGRFEDASRVYEQVLAMGLADRVTEANVRKDLGEIALACDNLASAEASFEAA